MKEGDLLLPTSKPSFSSSSSSSTGGGGDGGSLLFGRGRYKCYALAAIILLAFWSMLTGTVTLKWSATDLNSSDDFLSSPSLHQDLDVIEVEEREKVVRQMWEVYTHGRAVRLPKFWREAFEAAYEELVSDDEDVKDAAIYEIARMSMRMLDLDPPHTGHHHHTVDRNDVRIGYVGYGLKSSEPRTDMTKKKLKHIKDARMDMIKKLAPSGDQSYTKATKTESL